MSEWIKVSDRLPKDDQTVMVYTIGRTAALPILCYYDEEIKGFLALFSWQEIIVKADYWMELPDDPEDI